MTHANNSVVLFSKDRNVSAFVGSTLRAMPRITLEEHQSTLSEMNGAAVKLAIDNDLVIYNTDAACENDLAAIQTLRGQLKDGAVILALTDAQIPLADARRLIRAGADDVMPFPMASKELEDQIDHWTRPAEPKTAQPQISGAARLGKVITVAQARGGIGSTTLAVNLADRLLDRSGMFKKAPRYRVLLMDLDIQFGTIASLLDIDANDALYHLASNGSQPDAMFLRQSIVELPSGLSVMTAPARIAPLEALSPEQIATAIDLLRLEFDFVVVDLPRTLVNWVTPVLERTDKMMLVTDSSVPSIRQARRMIDFYTEDQLGLQIEIVVNHEAKPLISGRHHNEAAKVLERPLSHWIPYDPKSAREAADRGVPLSEASARAPIAKSVNALGRMTISGLTQQSQTTKTTN